MKVVGGPHDGIDVMVSTIGLGFVELINPIPQELAIDWLCSTCGRVSPVGPTVSRTIYTVRTFTSGAGPDGRIDYYHFLAPHDWTDMQALRHQFRK